MIISWLAVLIGYKVATGFEPIDPLFYYLLIVFFVNDITDGKILRRLRNIERTLGNVFLKSMQDMLENFKPEDKEK